MSEPVKAWKLRRLLRTPTSKFSRTECTGIRIFSFLIDFLREQNLIKAKALLANYEVVVSGGDRFPAVSSSARVVSHLNSPHEEADTKIILHCVDADAQSFQRVVVCSRGTDVFFLLIYNS